MATKTFEELKQLAIQIRDEKTNKQNTATRIGTQMLEHLDKLEQDYYDKTATDEELKERDEKLTELESIICNNIFDSETGKLVELKGRFQINRLFDIDSEPSVSFTPLLTIFKRYYNINGQFIGTNYTNDAKFIAIGGIINDDQTTINKNEVAKYMLSFNGVNYQCIDGLPLVNNDVKKINDFVKYNIYVQPHKYFFAKDINNIILNFSNIEDEYCDISIKSFGNPIILNVQNAPNIGNIDISFQHVPYKYGILYAKIENGRDLLNSFVVGRIGFYGTDVDILTPQIGFYYVPIIAWNEGKIIYKIENYPEYEEVRKKNIKICH